MSTIQELKQMIKDRVSEIYVNYINTTPQSGRRIMSLLADAGYVSDAPGCPQQLYTLAEAA